MIYHAFFTDGGVLEPVDFDTMGTPDDPGDDRTISLAGRLCSTLTVVKNVVNDDGGTKAPVDFTLHVEAAGADVAGSPQPGSTAGSTYVLTPGVTYSVSEEDAPGYVRTFSGDCAADGTVVLARGEHKRCTITNDDVRVVPPGGCIDFADFSPATGMQLLGERGDHRRRPAADAGPRRPVRVRLVRRAGARLDALRHRLPLPLERVRRHRRRGRPDVRDPERRRRRDGGARRRARLPGTVQLGGRRARHVRQRHVLRRSQRQPRRRAHARTRAQRPERRVAARGGAADTGAQRRRCPPGAHRVRRRSAVGLRRRPRDPGADGAGRHRRAARAQRRPGVCGLHRRHRLGRREPRPTLVVVLPRR